MLAIDADRCEHCGSRMKLRALVTLPASIERFLRQGRLWRVVRRVGVWMTRQ